MGDRMGLRLLGRTGVYVSELCLGTMMFGGPTAEAEAARIIDQAYEAGVNFIDTANAYTGGRSEEIVGRAIKARRDRWILATKVGDPVGPTPNDGGLSRRYIHAEIDASLKRLGTDYVDIYYLHKLDGVTPLEETLLAFADLIRAGKVRYIGLSNVRAWHIARIAHLCREMGISAPAILQPYYNLMNRQPEVEVLPAARYYGLGVAPYSPLARGVLSGKYRPGQTPGEGTRAGRGDERMLGSEWREASLAIAETLKAHAEARGTGLIDFALAWMMNNAAVTSVIAGPRTFEQWTSYVDALGYAWSSEDEAMVDSLVPVGHPSTPGYSDPDYAIEGRFARLEGASG